MRVFGALYVVRLHKNFRRAELIQNVTRTWMLNLNIERFERETHTSTALRNAFT
jgi:hypothetical protein